MWLKMSLYELELLAPTSICSRKLGAKTAPLQVVSSLYTSRTNVVRKKLLSFLCTRQQQDLNKRFYYCFISVGTKLTAWWCSGSHCSLKGRRSGRILQPALSQLLSSVCSLHVPCVLSPGSLSSSHSPNTCLLG